MEDIVKIFAANLNRLMKDRGENLTQLSDRIGVAYSTVSDWQHGRKMPRSGSLQKLADHFKVNITYLTSNHDTPSDGDLTENQRLIAYSIDPDISDEERQDIINLVKIAMKNRRRI